MLLIPALRAGNCNGSLSQRERVKFFFYHPVEKNLYTLLYYPIKVPSVVMSL